MSDNAFGPNPGDVPLRRFFGKYRGVVVQNEDPLLLGRIFVNVSSVPGVISSPAMPCVPYAGFQVGFVMIPPIGANVWVEFEAGDPSHPIWVGCFWTEGQFPVELCPTPLQKLIRTPTVSVLLNDLPAEGGVFVEIGPPGVDVPITISATTQGVVMEMAESIATFTPEEISVELPASSVVMTAEGFVVEASGSIEVTCPENNVTGNITVEGDVNITGAVEVTGDVEITGAVEVTGNVEVLGPVEVTGNVEISGAVEVTGNLDITGAIEFLGDIAGAGAVEVAGDIAVAGAVEVAGDIALAGAIEVAGAIVSPAYSPGLGNIL